MTRYAEPAGDARHQFQPNSRRHLHAKAKAQAGYRSYTLYDKISREDILAHGYAQCRSNKGAPGADGQDFADIEAYGVERWLGELALALRQETYRREPIRRVLIPKANGKLRPLSISAVCAEMPPGGSKSAAWLWMAHQSSISPNRR
jgi:hypothetical protein